MRNLLRLKISVKKPSNNSSSENSMSAKSERTKDSGDMASKKQANLVKSKSVEKIEPDLQVKTNQKF